MLEFLRLRRKPTDAGPPEPLLFLKKHGSFVKNRSELNRVYNRLKENPSTSATIDAIEGGPNAELYKKLVSCIKTTKVETEKGEYLVSAATALFVGNAVTDANIEGIIWCGGNPVSWENASDSNFVTVEFSETGRPEAVLLEERVREIMEEEFQLPQNEDDLKRNVELQIARIGRQLLSGSLERKAQTLGRKPQIGRDVGESMIDSLKQLREYFIPGLD